MSINTLPPGTHIAHIHLRVRSLQMAKTFYAGLMGMFVQPGSDENTLRLGATLTGPTLLYISAEQTTRTRPFRTTGLYHIAFLFADKYALACTFKRLLQRGWPIQGTADHGVSEAIYLADPEGNGIELYIDRPRSEWPVQDGKLTMTNQALDLDTLLAQLDNCPSAEIDARTRIGHIHLNVSDLDQALDFYKNLVGFEVTQDSFPGALFFSANGYHHHLGVNIWNGTNALPPPHGAAGLLFFTILIPDSPALSEIRRRMKVGDVDVFDEPDGFSAFDPSGIRVKFALATH